MDTKSAHVCSGVVGCTKLENYQESWLLHCAHQRMEAWNLLRHSPQWWFSFLVTAYKFLLSLTFEGSFIVLTKPQILSNLSNWKNSTHCEAWCSSVILYIVISGQRRRFLWIWGQVGLQSLKNFCPFIMYKYRKYLKNGAINLRCSFYLNICTFSWPNLISLFCLLFLWRNIMHGIHPRVCGPVSIQVSLLVALKLEQSVIVQRVWELWAKTSVLTSIYVTFRKLFNLINSNLSPS